jgi:hypothetical protein
VATDVVLIINELQDKVATVATWWLPY